MLSHVSWKAATCRVYVWQKNQTLVQCGSCFSALGGQMALRPSHLCRVSRELAAGSGLSAAGVDLTREQGWCCPGAAGDATVSGVCASAPPPPSRKTSLGPAYPGDATGVCRRGGVSTPGKLDAEPPTEGSVTSGAVAWLSAGGSGDPAGVPSPNRCCSSADFSSVLPSAERHCGRPSSEMLFRNKRAACLRLESLAFRLCSRCALAGLPLRLLAGKPHTAVAIPLSNTVGGLTDTGSSALVPPTSVLIGCRLLREGNCADFRRLLDAMHEKKYCFFHDDG